MPKHNSMKMHELLFLNVENFKYQFKLLVNASLKEKLHIKHCFNLIRLPAQIKNMLKIELLKTPLEYYRDIINSEESSM